MDRRSITPPPPPPPPPPRHQSQSYSSQKIMTGQKPGSKTQMNHLPPPPPPPPLSQSFSRSKVDDKNAVAVDGLSNGKVRDASIPPPPPPPPLQSSGHRLPSNKNDDKMDQFSSSNITEKSSTERVRPQPPLPQSKKSSREKLVDGGVSESTDTKHISDLEVRTYNPSISSNSGSTTNEIPTSSLGESRSKKTLLPSESTSIPMEESSKLRNDIIVDTNVDVDTNGREEVKEEITKGKGDPDSQSQPGVRSLRTPSKEEYQNNIINERTLPPLSSRASNIPLQYDRPNASSQSVNNQSAHHPQLKQQNSDRQPVYAQEKTQSHPQSQFSSSSGPIQRNDNSEEMHGPLKRKVPNSEIPDVSVVSSTWKTIWGKVEKGLDNLADLEDSVAGRAQQLLSTVRTTPTITSSSPGNFISQSTRKFQQRRNKKDSTPKMAAPTTTVLAPYGNKFEVAKKKEQEKKNPSISSTATTTQQRKALDDMATGRMIRATGGASSSNGQHPVPPSIPRPPNNMGIPANGTPQQRDYRGDNRSQGSTPKKASSNQGSQYGGSPYMQPSHLTTTAKEVPSESESHTRSSRIPWDISTTTRKPQFRQALPRDSGSKSPSYEEKESILSKLLQYIPSLKIPNPLKLFRFGNKSSAYQYASVDAWNAEDDDDTKSGFFRIFGSKHTQKAISSSERPSIKSGDILAEPLKNLLTRCDDGKSSSLLSHTDENSCRSIGRSQALFDGLGVMLLILAVQHLNGLARVTLPTSFTDLLSTTLPMLGRIVQDSMFTWTPIFVGYAYLSLYIKRVILNSRIDAAANKVGTAVGDDSQYAQLYLKLAAAVAVNPAIPTTMSEAGKLQVYSLVATSRLKFFATMLLGALVIMKTPFLGPTISIVGKSLTEIFALDQLRRWPVEWRSLGSNIGQILGSLAISLERQSIGSFNLIFENPLQFVFYASIFVSVALIALLPGLEGRRPTPINEDDEDIPISQSETTNQFSRLGSSSATRLTMLSENGSIESALDRWRMTKITGIDGQNGSALLLFRRFTYKLIIAMIALVPIVVSIFINTPSWTAMNHIGLRWDSIVDVTMVLVGLFFVASNAIENALTSDQIKRDVAAFLGSLSTVTEEIKASNHRQADIQFMASVSPVAGLMVRDLWAAHTTKRAWAVRGANFQCKNGELLVILGDDGTGKSRMLTTVAETLIGPPKQSLTSNKVRGFVGIGGVDCTKWDKSVLKRRLGVLLSDVHTIADTACLYSGCTLEEILDPVDQQRIHDSERKLGSSERASILLALKISGLFNTLIPKLPSKLSTVVTANEGELQPSALRPRSHALSPAEWSKLVLAKVLAQTIYDNENVAASTDKVEKCMIGSVLLLDEPTALLSEVDEAKLLKDLRQTGAATIVTTNKWAVGRFADNIVVVRDGAIVESGSHNDLISRGPQQSLYAAKWHAMTMQ